MVHEEHLRGPAQIPINEYKSRLSVAPERGPLIWRFYDNAGNVVYYNLENILGAPFNLPLIPPVPNFQWLVMCLCTHGVFNRTVRYNVQISLGNI